MIKKILLIFLWTFLFLRIINCQEKITVNDVSRIFNKANFQVTVDLATKAIQQSPDQEEFYYYLGASYAKLSKNDEAVNNLRIFLNKADYSKKPWMLKMGFQELVSVYKVNKDYSAIIEDSKFFLEKLKGNKGTENLESFCKNVIADAWREIGYQKASKEDYSGAIEALKKAIEYKSDDYVSMERIALYYNNLGKTDESSEYYLKAAMGWKSWRNKVSCLVPLANLLWKTDEFEKFSEKAESDTVSYNVISTIARIKKQNYFQAFSKMAEIEEKIGSKGYISSRLLKEVVGSKIQNQHVYFSFVVAFPENSSSVAALDSILNLGRSNAETAEIVRNEITPVLMNLVDRSNIQVSSKLLPYVVDMKFVGLNESRELFEQKANLYEELRKKYPDDAVREITKRQASLYADVLLDYKKAKELYEILIKKYEQKNLIPQLAKCLINLGEIDKVFPIMNEYLAGRDISEYAKFQAAQILIQANFFDEGVKILNEVDSTTKNKYLKQQIKDVLKDFRQYIKDDITIDTQKLSIIFNVSRRQYFYTNFVSLTDDCCLLYQETEKVEIVPFSAKRQSINCDITGYSTDRISLTEPQAMIFSDAGQFNASVKKKLMFSPDRWRKPEGMSIIFSWQDVKTDNIRIIRDYAVQDEDGVATIRCEKLKPDMKIEVSFSSRAGRFVSIFPEKYDTGSGDTMIFKPSAEIFEIKIRFKPSPNLLTYYPKVRVVEEKSYESVINSDVSDFPLKSKKTVFNIRFDSQLTVYSVFHQDEIIYEIDEKINI